MVTDSKPIFYYALKTTFLVKKFKFILVNLLAYDQAIDCDPVNDMNNKKKEKWEMLCSCCTPVVIL